MTPLGGNVLNSVFRVQFCKRDSEEHEIQIQKIFFSNTTFIVFDKNVILSSVNKNSRDSEVAYNWIIVFIIINSKINIKLEISEDKSEGVMFTLLS